MYLFSHLKLEMRVHEKKNLKMEWNPPSVFYYTQPSPVIWVSISLRLCDAAVEFLQELFLICRT